MSGSSAKCTVGEPCTSAFLERENMPNLCLIKEFANGLKVDDKGMRSHREVFGDFADSSAFCKTPSQAYSRIISLSTRKQCYSFASTSRKTHKVLRRFHLEQGYTTRKCPHLREKN